MLKHNDIIDKLTDEQKIRLLTSIGTLDGKDFKILGIDEVSIKKMKDYNEKIEILAYMVENGYHLMNRTMDDYCRDFSLEDIRRVKDQIAHRGAISVLGGKIGVRHTCAYDVGVPCAALGISVQGAVDTPP